jgi:hypothetical protein
MATLLGWNDYSRIYSNDGNEFVLESKIIPKGFPTNLGYSAKIVETIIQYLHYKHFNLKKNLNKVAPFEIEPSIALDLLKAAADLGI